MPRRSLRISSQETDTGMKPEPEQATSKRKRSSSVKAASAGSSSRKQKKNTTVTKPSKPTHEEGVIDPFLNIDGVVLTLDKSPCDVMLTLLDKAKNSDKYYIIQLVHQNQKSKDQYFVFTRWGRTGTKGTTNTKEFDKESDAIEAFCKKFQEKTGLKYEDRSLPPVDGKYSFTKQDFSMKQTGFSGHKWQYWVDDNVDGKINGWYDYSKEGSICTEQLYHEYLKNPNQMATRIVQSGTYSYHVDMINMTQTNVTHPNRTSRKIGRVLNGKTLPTPVKITTTDCEAKPAIVTPTSTSASSESSSTKKKKSGSHPVDKDIVVYHSWTLGSNFEVVKNEEDDLWYDSVLNQCNITANNNNNKYYRIQLLTDHNDFYVWFKWGRVGEPPQGKELKGPCAQDEAVKLFSKKYRDKTGNAFGAAVFKPKPKKYQPIQIDNDVSKEQQGKVQQHTVEKKQYAPSKLDAKTKDLIDVLFSEQMRDAALTNYDLDLKRLPLGVPSQSQIQFGISILNKIEEKLNGTANASSSYEQLSSEFYTAIPHSFGRRRPPVINDNDSLQTRYDMCNVLLDMYSTSETLRKINEKESKESKNKEKLPCPADSHYDSLNAELSILDKKSKTFDMISTYFNKTKSKHSNSQILDVWSVDRNGEKDRFEKYDTLDKNRRLLWHGTNIAVVAPILTSGLRIMPHSGGRVGSGIYLASMQEKSAGYTCAYGVKYACMFLAEAAMGDSHIVTKDGHHASSLRSAPSGFDSVHAVGRLSPETWKDMTIDGKTVKVPQDEGVMDSTVDSSFHHDEYLVYDEAQVRLRYVVTVKL